MTHGKHTTTCMHIFTQKQNEVLLMKKRKKKKTSFEQEALGTLELLRSLSFFQNSKVPQGHPRVLRSLLLIQLTTTFPDAFTLWRRSPFPVLYCHPCALVSEILHFLSVFSIYAIYFLT